MSGTLKIVSAGAGAGKTSRLSDEILQAIKRGVGPENIMATTFTTKAADELIERVRLKLLESGDNMAAAQILDGYVGTMNSVFGRLLREFALEMGLSPVQKVLAETEAAALFNQVAAEVIDKYYRGYRQVFHRLGQEDWRESVLRTLELARQNGMNSTDVKACAEYSWNQMRAWLPEALPNSELLDEDLRAALVVARSQLPGGDTTKATAQVIADIDMALKEWDRHESLSWQQWAKLSKLKPGAKSRDAVSPILIAACKHARHLRLHQDMKAAMFAVFHCAAEAMDTYASEKGKGGLIDFTDQESLALQLLKNEQNLELLKDRISEVFVDEFQDSSPLQIALNMRLREIAERATWVGDVKQAIYGFRGTDPELMKTAMDSITDLAIEVLDDSYRSRESLVTFVNAIFVPVFQAKGMAPEKIKLAPKRKDKREQAVALEMWSYPNSKNKETDAASLAVGMKSLLSQTEQYLIVDKTSRQVRPLKPGDIAILCRANDECLEVAEALSRIGVSATVGESGLLTAPEVVYAVASMRYLVDKNDTLAMAEIVHFSSEKLGEGRWLSPWLQAEKPVEIFGDEPMIKELDRARAKIIQMSPSEVLDLALVTAKVDEVSLQWGQGDQRLANLDALRSIAVYYEEVSATNGTAATTTGFLLYLREVENNKELNRLGESIDDKAVRVLTYHKAKGLEWPFVILNSLNKSSEKQALPPVFNQVTAVSTTPFHVDAPLDGRRLYFWPWPYGKQAKDVGLDGYVENASELKQKRQSLLDENQRLMYVGMTRARDYLVFTTRDFTKAHWIQELTDAAGEQVMTNLGIAEEDPDTSNSGNADGEIIVRGEVFPCRIRHLSIDASPEEAMNPTVATEISYVGKIEEPMPFVPARFRPSGQKVKTILDETGIRLPIVDTEIETNGSRIHSIGRRLPLSGTPDMANLGEMVHAFLATDHPQKTKAERLALAQAIRQRYAAYELSEDSMVQAADQLERFLSQHYPDILERHREWPIHMRKGLQRTSGWIDLLLRTPKGWVIVDHKTFPGKKADWLFRGLRYLPQLRTYAEAIYKATDRPVYEAWIHMPVVGSMIKFTEKDIRIPE
ncbi:UvrD-helicase domain-containing protein [Heliobacterium mobile]|nr:UvrD-helicase domain-containing protein [Heliobacterium mobile]